MSKFDPYHKWLGIPPKDQPPHHYRLLSLELFETDTDVIDAAANQRMAYLQGMGAGEYGDESQKLLNELAQARICLLDPKRKQEYDRKLKAKLAAAEPKKTAKPDVPVAPLADVAPALPPLPAAVPVPPPLPSTFAQSTSAPSGNGFHGAPVPPPLPVPLAVAAPPAVMADFPLPVPLAVDAPGTSTAVADPPRLDVRPAIRTATGGPVAAAKPSLKPNAKPTTQPAAKPTASTQRRPRKSPWLLVCGLSFVVLLLGGFMLKTLFDGRGNETSPSKTNGADPDEFVAHNPVVPGKGPNNKPPLPTPPKPAPPKPAPPRVSPDVEALESARKLLFEEKVDAAAEVLRPLTESDSSEVKERAAELLEQIEIASNAPEVANILMELDDDKLLALAEGKFQDFGRAVFRYPVLHTRFMATVKKVLPSLMEERNPLRPRPEPKPEPMPEPEPKPKPEPTATKPVPIDEPKPKPKEPALEPRELLSSKGLKKVQNTWVLNEDEVAKLVAAFNEERNRYEQLERPVKGAYEQVAAAEAQLKTGSLQPVQQTLLRSQLDQTNQAIKITLRQMFDTKADLKRKCGIAQEAVSRLEKRYDDLREDENVTDAIKQLKGILGPTSQFESNRTQITRTMNRFGLNSESIELKIGGATISIRPSDVDR